MRDGVSLCVLLVDDGAAWAHALAEALGRWAGADDVRQIEDEAALEAALDTLSVDVVLTRETLGRMTGPAVLRLVKERRPECPVVLLAEGDEAAVGEAVRAGFDGAVAAALPDAARLLAMILVARELAAERAARRRTEQALRESEDRAHAVFESTGDGIIIIDARGTVVSANAAAGRLLGMDPSELVGRGLHEYRGQSFDESGAPLRYEQLPPVRALRGEPASLVKRLRTPNGREAIVRAASAPVRGSDGAIIGAVHIVHDVTEDHARARQAAQGARLRALGELAGGVAHDLNQYLSLVAGYGELALEALGRPTPDIESARDSIVTMIRGALNGGETVRRLLLFARPTPEGPPRAVDLADVLREVAKLTAPRWRDEAQQRGRPISVELEVEGDVTIHGWAGDLRETFANLLLNAIDALPEGGTIRLTARAQGGEVTAEVADTGIGVPPQHLDRLFEPFFSTKGEGGSGLGLAIVYGIVERHGGRISVESAPGRGTTFRLSFPPAAPAALSTGDSGPVQAARRFRILVVEDEPALALMLTRLLQTDGHEVTTAVSAEEALARLADQPADVVITDLGLGTGMNGWELAATLRARPNPPRIVLATGWGAEIDEQAAAERGVEAVLSKPFRLSDVRRVLAQF